MLEEAQDKLTGREMVLQLTAQDVTDYERGRIQGKIEMLTYLMRELAEDETSSV